MSLVSGNNQKIRTFGIDGRFYGEAGPGRYVKNIIQHLEIIDKKNKYVVFLRPKGFNSYTTSNPNFIKVMADYKWYSWSEQINFLFLVLKYKLDLFYVPHFNIPVLYPGKLITAIPDIIMHSYSTEKGTTLPRPYFKFKKFIYKLVVLWAVLRSKKVIVPSKDVLSDFKKAYPHVPENKYLIVYEGMDPDCKVLTLDPQQVLNQLKITKPFLLYVSSMYEHKNIPRLVKGFKILREKYDYKGKLVLVGKKDAFSASIVKLVQELNYSDWVIIPGEDQYVTDPLVVALRTEAEVFVFPSLKEGFSLTPLEAQYHGLVCVISDIPCHREIYEDTVHYFDPYNEEDIAKKINDVLTDKNLANSLVQKGHELASKYDWINTATETLKVFEEYV